MLSLVIRPHRVHRKSDRLTESRRGEGGKYEWLQIDRFLGRDSLHSIKLISFYFFCFLHNRGSIPLSGSSFEPAAPCILCLMAKILSPMVLTDTTFVSQNPSSFEVKFIFQVL